MATIIRIPTWATFYKFPEDTPSVGLAALNTMLGTNLSAGDVNPVWPDLQDLDLGGGPLTRGAGSESISQVTEIENTSFLKVTQAALAVGIGGEIDGWEVVFEIDDLTAEVPASFPDRTYTEDEVTNTHTWATWGLDGNRPDLAPEQIGDKWYRTSQLGSSLGAPMPASQWVPAMSQGLVVLKAKPSA